MSNRGEAKRCWAEALDIWPNPRESPGFEPFDQIAGSRVSHRMRRAVYLFFGGLIMTCAPAVPGYISHGALSLALVDSPVDSGVAKGI